MTKKKKIFLTILLGVFALCLISLLWFSIDTMWWHIKSTIRYINYVKQKGETIATISHEIHVLVFIFLGLLSLFAWLMFCIYLFVKKLFKK